MSGPVAATSNQQRFADWNPEEVNVGSIWIGFSLCMIAAQCLRGPYAYAGLCNWGMCMVNLAFQTFFTWTSKYYPGTPKYSGTSQIGSVSCYVRGAFQPFFTSVMKGPPTYIVQSLWPPDPTPMVMVGQLSPLDTRSIEENAGTNSYGEYICRVGRIIVKAAEALGMARGSMR